MKQLITMVLMATLVPWIAGAEEKIVGSVSTDGFKSRNYSSFAKISMMEASARATAMVPGKVTEIALESEDGYLVYSVEIITADRNKSEVLIDAGNGTVLSTEEDD